MPGLLTNLKIIGLKDPSGASFDIPLLFVCMFNPDTYTVEHTVNYDNRQANGQTATDGVFNYTVFTKINGKVDAAVRLFKEWTYVVRF